MHPQCYVIRKRKTEEKQFRKRTNLAGIIIEPTNTYLALYNLTMQKPGTAKILFKRNSLRSSALCAAYLAVQSDPSDAELKCVASNAVVDVPVGLGNRLVVKCIPITIMSSVFFSYFSRRFF